MRYPLKIKIINQLINQSPKTHPALAAPASQLSETPETKEEFYESLASIIKNVPSSKQIAFLGDFNARVGADHDLWPSCSGHRGTRKMNANRQRLLAFCNFHGFNSF